MSEGESRSIWPPELEKRLQELSRQQEIVSFLLSGTSGTSGFAHFKNGELARSFVFQEGNLIQQVGTVLPEEKLAFAEKPDDGEQAILLLVERLTVDWAKVAATEFALFEFDEF